MERLINVTTGATGNGAELADNGRPCVPFGAYILAVVLGILAPFAAVSGIILAIMAADPPLWVDPFFLLLFVLSSGISAVFFGFLWPTVSWKWGLWLSLPFILVAVLVNMAGPASNPSLLGMIAYSFLMVFPPTFAGALAGQRCALRIQSASEEQQGQSSYAQPVSASPQQATSLPGFGRPATQLDQEVEGAFLTEQIFVAGRQPYVTDKPFDDTPESQANNDSRREADFIPTPDQLFELFSQFQSPIPKH